MFRARKEHPVWITHMLRVAENILILLKDFDMHRTVRANRSFLGGNLIMVTMENFDLGKAGTA